MNQNEINATKSVLLNSVNSFKTSINQIFSGVKFTGEVSDGYKNFEVALGNMKNNLINIGKVHKTVIASNPTDQINETDPKKKQIITKTAQVNNSTMSKIEKSPEVKETLSKEQQIKNIEQLLESEYNSMKTIIEWFANMWAIIKKIWEKIWNFIKSFFTAAEKKIKSKEQASQQTAGQQGQTNQSTTATTQQTQQEQTPKVSFVFESMARSLDNHPVLEAEKQEKKVKSDHEWEVFKHGIIGSFYRLLLAFVNNALLIYLMKKEGIYKGMVMESSNVVMEQEGSSIWDMLISGISWLFGKLFNKSWDVLVHALNNLTANSVLMVLFAIGYFYNLYLFFRDIYYSMRYLIMTSGSGDVTKGAAAVSGSAPTPTK